MTYFTICRHYNIEKTITKYHKQLDKNLASVMDVIYAVNTHCHDEGYRRYAVAVESDDDIRDILLKSLEVTKKAIDDLPDGSQCLRLEQTDIEFLKKYISKELCESFMVFDGMIVSNNINDDKLNMLYEFRMIDPSYENLELLFERRPGWLLRNVKGWMDDVKSNTRKLKENYITAQKAYDASKRNNRKIENFYKELCNNLTDSEKLIIELSY